MTKNYSKQVRVVYWHNGIKKNRIVDAASAQSWKQTLREYGASGIKIQNVRAKI